MFNNKKQSKQGFYSLLSSSEKKKIVFGCMRAAKRDQEELLKRYDKELNSR